MSEFSDACKKLIKENGTNIYRLSMDTGLERTALQRMVSGKRLPNEEYVKKFMRSLRIPTREETRLLELYKCEVTGETTYYNRRYVQQIINNMIAAIQNDGLPESDRLNDKGSSLLSPHLELVLNKVLKEAYKSDETNFVLTNYPITNASFVREILRLTKEYEEKTIPIKHLFSLRIKPEEVLYNLKVLNYMLPLANSQYLNYEGYFQYARVEENDYLLLMYPFYVMTKKQVLVFNNTFTDYMLFSSENDVNKFHKEFKNLLDGSRPLIERIADNSKAYMRYVTLYSGNAGIPVALIESQPCFWEMMSRETFLTILKNRAPELYDIGVTVASQTYLFGENSINLFSKDGLKKFCETGKYEGQIGAFLPPLILEERKEALLFLLNKKSNQKGKVLLMSDEFYYPGDMYLEVTDHKQVGIYNLSDLQNLRFFTIGDSNIGEAFFDFAAALVESEYVLSEDETREFILEMLDNLSKYS